MTVPNRFHHRMQQRDHFLMAAALWAALAGAGAAAVLFVVVGGLLPMSAAYRLGLLIAFAGGFGAAYRFWTAPEWTPGDGLIAGALGALWLGLGFTPSPIVGAVPLLVGAVLAGVTIGGVATERRQPVHRVRTP